MRAVGETSEGETSGPPADRTDALLQAGLTLASELCNRLVIGLDLGLNRSLIARIIWRSYGFPQGLKALPGGYYVRM